jgi:hypothetical protein
MTFLIVLIACAVAEVLEITSIPDALWGCARDMVERRVSDARRKAESRAKIMIDAKAGATKRNDVLPHTLQLLNSFGGIEYS